MALFRLAIFPIPSRAFLEEQLAEFVADPVFELRPERLSVEEFISLTLKLA